MIDTEGGWPVKHPPCSGPCGELADECACPRPALRLTTQRLLDDLDDPPCRKAGCTARAETKGLCDPHYETL